MSAHEVIDILNEGGEVIGTVSREQAERDNHVTENVLIFVFNSLGRVWTQLRPISKNHFPGKWDISACGGVLSSETPAQAADREMLEEMGFGTDLHHVESFLNVFPGDQGEERKRLSHLYVGVSDETPVVNDEVDEFRLWEPEELRQDVLTNPGNYIPSFAIELDKAVAGYEQIVR